ncbi:MAG: hypothetical protein QOE72_3608 [Chloroflexota bacterium]|jgi:protein-L-isoaspartate(D-aspartate) O-methyltransferase|nr:hypothetical protein [Chloroflexota bacterium]
MSTQRDPDPASVQQGLRELVAQLEAGYAIPSAEWAEIVGRVPRHRFLPRWYDWQGEEEPREYVGSDDVERWLRKVYADEVVPIDPRDEHRSSSSQPSMMLAFLSALDPATGHTVLEIGTGSGYNAALLCERVGSRNVTTIDIEPELVTNAADRLTQCGYTPTVAVADGAQGYPAKAPYDRIIATCSVPRIPAAWIDQLKPGGVLVTPLAGGCFEYGLVRLTKQPHGGAEGRLRFEGASFMRLRQPGRPSAPVSEAVQVLAEAPGDGATRPCSLPTALAHRSTATWGLMFMIGAAVQEVTWLWRGPSPDWGEYDREHRRQVPAIVSSLDRSWARVSRGEDGQLTVTEGGPRRLWDIVEECRALFLDQGEPMHARYGMTVTGDRRQWLWLDCPDSGHCWELTG